MGLNNQQKEASKLLTIVAIVASILYVIYLVCPKDWVHYFNSFENVDIITFPFYIIIILFINAFIYFTPISIVIILILIIIKKQ